MIHLLSAEERLTLADIYEQEFEGSVVPESVLAVMDDGEIMAFISSEMLLRIGMLWVKPELRDTPKSVGLVRELIKYVYLHTPKNMSTITVASEDRYKTLFKKLGMREVDGTLFRKDARD